MKNIKFIPVLLLGAMLFSCGNFLEELPQTSVPKETFYKTETDFELANVGIYELLRPLYGVGAANYGAWMMGEMRSDNTTYLYNVENRGYADREYVALFTDDANGGAVSNKYNYTYYLIQRANQVIEHIENADISESAYNNYKGQALFMRAFGYFDLVQYFGGVPLVTVAPTSYDQTLVPRSSAEEVYEQILEDVTEAARILPPVSEQEPGFVSQGTAYTLLGNVHIVLQNWAEAESALKNVTGYSLLNDYADIFDPDNKNHAESIFEIQYWDDLAAGQRSDFAYNFLPILSNPGLIPGFPDGNANTYAGWNIPTPEMIDAYEPGDLRKDTSIGFFTGDPVYNYVDFPYIKKYVHGAVQAEYCNDNWPVYRYAEVLLFLAEALNEQGKAEALDYLNMVHAHPRTGLSPITTTDQASLRELIQQERRVELAFENKRWLDLVRTGKAVEVMTEFGRKFKADPTRYYYPVNVNPATEAFTVTAKRLIFPIPQREIRLNPDMMEQNDGY